MTNHLRTVFLTTARIKQNMLKNAAVDLLQMKRLCYSRAGF